MASPADLWKIGLEGFDLIDKYYGRVRRPPGGFAAQQWYGRVQVPKYEVPIIVNNNDAAAQFGGKMIDNNPKPNNNNDAAAQFGGKEIDNNTKPKPSIRNWGRKLV